MRAFLPNSAHLMNFGGFLRKQDWTDEDSLHLELHQKWVSVHPATLALVGCAGSLVLDRGGTVTTGTIPDVAALHYLIRMGLFDRLGLKNPKKIIEHEASGRFIPLTQVRSKDELKKVILDVIPLLHASPEEHEPIKYVISELVRNALEHAASPVGCFFCAQYYPKIRRLSVGVADAGVGVLGSMRRFHPVADSRSAILWALRPGVTGVTRRLGGNEYNAGAGLFFCKGIAQASRNFFVLYSGDAMFKLLKTSEDQQTIIYADPSFDRARNERVPYWPGTVVGLDITVQKKGAFKSLLDLIHDAYRLDLKAEKKKRYKTPRFV